MKAAIFQFLNVQRCPMAAVLTNHALFDCSWNFNGWRLQFLPKSYGLLLLLIVSHFLYKFIIGLRLYHLPQFDVPLYKVTSLISIRLTTLFQPLITSLANSKQDKEKGKGHNDPDTPTLLDTGRKGKGHNDPDTPTLLDTGSQTSQITNETDDNTTVANIRDKVGGEKNSKKRNGSELDESTKESRTAKINRQQ